MTPGDEERGRDSRRPRPIRQLIRARVVQASLRDRSLDRPAWPVMIAGSEVCHHEVPVVGSPATPRRPSLPSSLVGSGASGVATLEFSAMRCIGYLGRLGSALALSALFLTSTPASAQDSLLEIYNDPVEFERLSNAAQNMLIARFGPRPRFDEKGNPIPATQDPGRRKARRSAPLLPNDGVVDVLGTVLVNDAAGDVTAQDTQSETALVLGTGSNLVCAFNDSGSFLGTDSFTGWAYSSDSGASWTDPGL